jgi:hypothetical protein
LSTNAFEQPLRHWKNLRSRLKKTLKDITL